MMKTYEVLFNELMKLVRDKSKTAADLKAVSKDLFEAMGGEAELKRMKTEYLKEKRKNFCEADYYKISEFEEKIDEMERYKAWMGR